MTHEIATLTASTTTTTLMAKLEILWWGWCGGNQNIQLDNKGKQELN